MKRDAWYASIAALGLCAAAATYALIDAPRLADPNVQQKKSRITASLPAPPVRGDYREALAAAQAILEKRDPFTPASDGQVAAARGLALPKLGPPVRFSAPGETRRVAAAPSAPTPVRQPQPQAQRRPAPIQTQAPAPAMPVRPGQPEQPRGSLTLRGVYPSPHGGRALVALPDGSMVSVGVGGVVGGWRVMQIQQGAIRLGRGQRALLLAMPR